MPICDLQKKGNIAPLPTFSVLSKYCAPTFNVLSDCKVRRDYMAVACPYLRSVIVCGCVLNERAVKILGKFFGEKLHK